MGIFDIDSGTDNHMLNEQFHVFSKSPASVATALGDASNRSGHTVTATDVWGQEIPAFFFAKTAAVAETYKALAKKNDLCRIGNSVAIFKDGEWSVDYALYTDIPDGHVFLNSKDEPVIRFHKTRKAHLLGLENNANDDGLNTTAKIQGWDVENSKPYDYVATAPKFVTQFVTSTDKIVDGVPSKGYGPFVMTSAAGDITTVLNEGTSDSNHYVANSFAGIIQYNKARPNDNIFVHAFEYCGKTLGTTASDIAELEDKLSKISVTAAGGVQALSDAAKSAGFEIEAVVADGVTTPTLDIETGSVATGVTKLVTGDAVNTAIKNAIDAIPEVQAATTEVAGVVTISTNDAIAIDATSTAAATVAAVAATRSEIAEEMGALSLAVTSAQGAAQEAAASASASETAATAAQSAAQSAQSASETAASNASASASAAAQSATSASNAETAAKAAQTAAQGSATSASQSASAAQTAQQQATASAQSAAQAATDAKAAKDFVEALTIPEISTVNSGDQLDINDHVIEVKTSKFTAQTDTTSTSIGSMTANENGLATGATVVAVANDALRAAKAYSNSLHTTSVTYHVTDTLPTVPAGKEEEYKGRIYLVLTGVDGVVAADGDRIEYMYVQENGVWGWEQIGTTTADLADYAKDADVIKSIATANGVSGTVTNNVATITVQDGTINQKGIVQLSNTIDGSQTSAVTAKAVMDYAISDIQLSGRSLEKTGAINFNIGQNKLDHIGTWIFEDQVNNEIIINPFTFGYTSHLASDTTNWHFNANARTEGVKEVVNNKVYTSDFYYGNSVAGYMDTSNIINGHSLFHDVNTLSNFNSDLSALEIGHYMFYGTVMASFINDMPNLADGRWMFGSPVTDEYPSTLKEFVGDLSSLLHGDHMFDGQFDLETFVGDLSSLLSAHYMFGTARLSDESIENIADGINTINNRESIHIGIKGDASTLSDRQHAAFTTIYNKGWSVYVNNSEYTPAEPSAITTTDENGEVRTTPIPFYAKAVEVSEKDAEYVDNAGKFYRVLGGQFIYVNDPETYGMFTCLEDAVANMRLTKYVKPEVEA